MKYFLLGLYKNIVWYLFLLLYTLYSIMFGSPLPWEWSAKETIYAAIPIAAIASPILLKWVFTALDAANISIESLFEMDKYKPYKILDAIFEHYTNVATVGLFFGVFIYASTSVLKSFNNGGVSIVIAVAYVLCIMVYVLFITRMLLFLALRKSFWKYAISYVIVAFDMYLIKIFIIVAPKVS